MKPTRYPILDSKLRPFSYSYGFINISCWWLEAGPAPPPPIPGGKKLSYRELDDLAREQEEDAKDEAALPPLEIEIISGLSLRSMDFMEESDSYVKVKLGRVEQKTKIIKSADPLWQESFRYYPSSRHDTIYFTVLDYDGPAGSEIIGTATLSLEDIPDVGISSPNRWIELKEESGKIQVGVR